MRTVLFSFFVLGTLGLCAQASRKNSITESGVAKPVADTLIKSAFTEGTIPTPEEQGFSKQSSNGKDSYFKESNSIRIEYRPKPD